MLGFSPISSAPIASTGASGESYVIAVNEGSFAATGQAVTLNKALRLDAQSRVFTLSLQGAAKLITEFVPDGQFAVSVQEINFGRSVAFGAGSFVLTGQGASKQLSHVFNAGEFDLSQEEINFGFSFAALAGSFAVTGQEITEDITDVFGSGSFALTLQDASVTAQRFVAVTSGSFGLTGHDFTAKGFLSPSLPPKLYAEQTVPSKTWVEPIEPTGTWAEQTGTSSPTFAEASDVSTNTWTEAA